MKKRMVGVLGGMLAAVLVSGVAHAQDHLLCYTLRDPATIGALADLFAAQPEFTQTQCKIKKPIEFCVPASKQGVEPATAVTAVVPGQPLQDDYICYSVTCPKQVLPPSKNILDQFGAHFEKSFSPSKVCVPAAKASLPCGALPGTSATASPKCGGECPATAAGLDQKCALVGGQCTCAPATCGGPPDKGGMCGGGCPNPADVCRPSPTTNATTGAVTGVTCQCVSPGSPCGPDTAGMCGGDCSTPGAQCLPDPTTPNGCSCVGLGQAGTAQLCDQVPGSVPMTCNNGVCPPGEECTTTTIPGATAPSCGCVPKPCALDSAGACAGACPNGAPCGPDPNNPIPGQCTCLPQPCGPDPGSDPPQCSGDCASGECLLDAANQCSCHSPCGLDPLNNQCGGACQFPGETCTAGPAGGPACICAKPPTPGCGLYPATAPVGQQMCGGTCPTAGQTCKIVTSRSNPNGTCMCK